MEKSKVYFTNMKTKFNYGLLQKLEKLIKEAGIETIDFNKKFAAIKINFGEPGNMAYIRPNYAKTVADTVKSLGGMPFLTDCNTLYVGRRKQALEHMDSAYENGFTLMTTGCHVIIADGLKGTNEVRVPINGELVKEAKIGTAIMDADVIISLNHFKGHEQAGFGGAIKNLGMGCGSRAGKMEMHSDGKPNVSQEKCVGCGMCAKICAHSAISYTNKKASIDLSKCVGCGRCIGVCAFNAIKPDWGVSIENFNKKMAEYAWAVVKDRPSFHINLVMDVSPFCDCHAENDIALVPNVGMFASFDPVALDKACADMVNKQPVLFGSAIEGDKSDDHFHAMHPTTDWLGCLKHAEKIGLGTLEYELIEVK
ncbi:MAG: DUF362 domain-containing protein [Clostridia bacterium]|jgi:uncharacterized Fe-S center protein|nr:DUF362 domain-containing protein [Clostridia bacterium]MCI2000166.1 DUF362 domain-containing protein [Clostridia bacterium]MCI2014669.1 DUF362 domain-containing protein [Clostridia bacterium]